MEINVDLDLPPSLPETICAVQQLTSGKASGSDTTPTKIYKHSGRRLMDQLSTLFQVMWCCGQAPQDSSDATIVHRYNSKGTGNSVTITDVPHYLTSSGKSPPAPISIAPTNASCKDPCRNPTPTTPEHHRHDVCRSSATGEVSEDANPPLN
ncbi:hypothetical protein SprV_0200709600 [Sparganum proliferum]